MSNVADVNGPCFCVCVMALQQEGKSLEQVLQQFKHRLSLCSEGNSCHEAQELLAKIQAISDDMQRIRHRLGCGNRIPFLEPVSSQSWGPQTISYRFLQAVQARHVAA